VISAGSRLLPRNRVSHASRASLRPEQGPVHAGMTCARTSAQPSGNETTFVLSCLVGTIADVRWQRATATCDGVTEAPRKTWSGGWEAVRPADKTLAVLGENVLTVR